MVKPLEEDGKPVTKYKFYRGMVKVVWNCGTETVAYTKAGSTDLTEKKVSRLVY